MPRITEAGRERQGRGIYVPGEGYSGAWVKGRESGSVGTVHEVKDWVTGRTVYLLSETELHVWALLRFRDDVTDVWDQVPLWDERLLKKVAAMCRHPEVGSRERKMTTDLLTQMADGSIESWSVKPSQDILKPEHYRNCTRKKAKEKAERAAARLNVERAYWEARGLTHHVVFGDEIDVWKAVNILDCTRCWARPTEADDAGYLARWLVAHKRLLVELGGGPVPWGEIARWLATLGDAEAKRLNGVTWPVERPAPRLVLPDLFDLEALPD